MAKTQDYLGYVGESIAALSEARYTPAALNELERLVMRAQAGDAEARERVLMQSQEFVARVAARCARRYLHWSNDDELSVAWLALNKAIDQFRPESGTSFLSFAKVLIRRRLADYFRQENRQAVPVGEVPVSVAAAATHDSVYEEQERSAELVDFGKQLQKFGLTLREIAAEAPRRDARQVLVRAAATLVAHDELLAEFYASGRIPVSALAKYSGVHPKAIERGRKYLIALVLLLDGDYPYLQEYLRPLLRGAQL